MDASRQMLNSYRNIVCFICIVVVLYRAKRMKVIRKEARGDFSWKDKRDIWKAIFSFEVSLWKITFKILIRAISHKSIRILEFK